MLSKQIYKVITNQIVVMALVSLVLLLLVVVNVAVVVFVKMVLKKCRCNLVHTDN